MHWIIMFLLALLVGCNISENKIEEPSAEGNTDATRQEITNSIGMKLILLPKRKFTMGSPRIEKGAQEDEGQHEVTISQDFYLGAFEVTQQQYIRLMGFNPSYFLGKNIEGDSENNPVEQVSWDQAVEYCNRLSNLPEEKRAGRVYRLPTEEEWEYACRAGSKTAYCFGDSERELGQYAWFAENSGGKTHPVGQKKPNKWGLYDMHGNAWEWCADWDARISPVGSDSVGLPGGSARVRRGGSWGFNATECRSASRFKFTPRISTNLLGFRLAMTVRDTDK